MKKYCKNCGEPILYVRGILTDYYRHDREQHIGSAYCNIEDGAILPKAEFDEQRYRDDIIEEVLNGRQNSI